MDDLPAFFQEGNCSLLVYEVFSHAHGHNLPVSPLQFGVLWLLKMEVSDTGLNSWLLPGGGKAVVCVIVWGL